MLRMKWCAMALAVAAFPAQAQDAGAVAALRQELESLRARLEVLEKKLQKAQAKPAPVVEAPASAPAAAASSAFNPGISAILNGVYANLQRDPGTYRIGGFVPSGGEVAPPRRGLGLGESEIGLSANVDPMFRGTLVAALSPDNDSVGVEEATLQTLGLSNGFTIKAGRFFSEIGYQNRIHAHAWDFTDAPLVLKAFLGGQLAEDGVQLKWIAPTSVYFDVGAELGRGRAFPAATSGKNGFGSSNLFAHLGDDIGESWAWQGGLSLFSTSPRERTYTDTDSLGTSVTNSFSGTSRTWALSGVLKWAPEGNATDKNLKLQGEYFRRRENGALTYDTQAASLGTRSGSYDSRQSGWYAQAVYQFMPMWRAGYRYDRLASGVTTLGLVDTGALSPGDFPILGGHHPKRHAVMVDWSPSEFSRVRLQFARDYSRAGLADSQVFLQYIVSLGAHGAHTF